MRRVYTTEYVGVRLDPDLVIKLNGLTDATGLTRSQVLQALVANAALVPRMGYELTATIEPRTNQEGHNAG